MKDTITRARTQTFEHTITGLLTKRADLFNEAERLRDRQAQIRNDVQAIDRVLSTLGYTGNLDAEMPRQKQNILFGPGELTGACFALLRDAEGPMTSRELARGILAVNEQDPRDRRLLTEVVKRVSKAMRVAKQRGLVAAAQDQAGNMVWHAGG
ncbi:MAG: hypothetical protein AB7F96_08835 [Beijerinckiaceae bacterium]